MARNLQELQKQYNSAQGPMSLRGGRGGGPPHGRMAKGKPKFIEVLEGIRLNTCCN